jgi:DNA-directed RNA polymerase II subunit RPB2
MSNIGNKNDEYQNLSKIDWNVINTYFNSFKYYITKHHLDSYNNFISSTIPSIIKNLNPMKTLKTDTEKRLKHEIKTYIGGKNGDQIFLSKPYLFDENKTRVLYPNEARLKDLNYVADLRVNIYIEYLYYNSKGDVQEKKVEFNNIKIGVIPIMLHSNICVLNNQEQLVLKEMGECPFDQGGYFIISGKEKVLISQERNTTNRLYITESKDDKYSLEANMMCTSDVDPFPKTVKLYIFDEQYKINKEVTKLDKILDNIINKRNNAIIVDCFHIDDKIPLFILFRALGIESDKNILEYIVGDLDDPNNKPLIDFLRYSIIDGNFLHTQEQCLKYLSHYVQYNNEDEVRYILANDFLQNIGYNLKSKALYLGFLVNKLIKTKLGIITLTNRDNYIHKRIDTSGFLLGKLFRDFFNDFRNDAVRKIDSIYHYQLFGEKESVTDNLINKSNIKYIFNQDHIENGLIKSLKGQWGRLAKPSDSGISQDLGRLSYLEYVSHTRRVSNPLDTSVVKISEPRQLSGSQIGYMCPIESPDGGNIGLLKHMSVLCNISTEVNPKIIESKLNEFEDVKLLKDIEAINIKNYTKIFINNNWYGVITKDPRSIYKKFKEYRINKEINFDISITWDIKENELKFLCDSGRCIRPLYIVKKNKVLIDEHSSHINFNTIKWENLNQFIEYIDVEECNTRLIAMDRLKLDNSLQPYTNCEIHPSTILSIYTNTIPFCNRNQLPRNVFSGQQGKQAIGIYATNFNSRIDTRSYVLHYPQRALVHSKYTKFSHNDELPNGENVIVAIMTYTGYNQEDSIIINKSSIQRGMFNITAFKSVIDEEIENENAGEKIEFANPINMTKNGINIDIPWANWENIDEFGFPNENTYMRENDIIIGKIRVSTNKNGDKTYTNKSIPATNIINGTIDRKFIYKKADGLKKIKIRMRKFKIPDLGDKLACYSDDTEILTTDGWILFKNLTKENKVATLVNKKLIYQNPIELQSYNFKGQLYEVDSNQVKLLVTDNHRMYTRTRACDYKMEEAKNIFNKLRHYKKNCDIWEPDLTDLPTELKMENGIVTKFIIPSCLYNKKKYPMLELDINAWLTFYGIWLAEGCFLRDYGISISTHKQRVKKELEEVSIIMNLNIHKHKDTKDDEVRNAWIYSDEKQLVEYMLQFKKTACFKYMAQWVWYLNREQCKILIHGMMLGDGHTMENGTRRYDTSSTLLADNFQRLCLHAGWSCNKILKYEAGHTTESNAINNLNGKITSNYDAWRLTIIESQNEPIVNKYRSDGHKFDKWTEYDSKVYCCTVPEGEGILYVRRNNFPVWSGNSRNGQKGVCGMIYNQENMPYTKDGIIPDLIINPHAIPSRMTIAHLVECVLGKLCCLKGVSIDATAFESHDIDKYYNILSDEFKYNKYGNEYLYNGFTGEQMPAEIFIGPTYYYRLKHMVYDKINSRYGKVYTNHSKKPEKQNLGYDRLTEQPVQGRARGGGLRVGEMESNGLLAHGISGFIRESLMERSDMKLFDINEDTGHLGYYDNELKTPLSTENINNMETNNYIKNSMPYAYKLLTQELEGLGISTQFITKDVDNELNNDDEFVGEIPESDDEEGVEEKKEDNEE